MYGGLVFPFSSPVTVNQAQTDLYFDVVTNVNGIWNADDFAARVLPGSPPRRDRITLTRDCRSSSGPGTTYGVAVNANYIIFGCDDALNGVLVYRNVPGEQHLVRMIRSMSNPTGIVFGP